jgi:hypothetical protein
MMSEDGDSTLSKSSSSQHSHASQGSKKTKASQTRARGSHSTSGTPGHKSDPSLTSFPSFSPEQSKAQLAAADKNPTPMRTTSQKTRERKATLAGLTSASPSINRHNALFDDSPRSSFDFPGALNLATDEHIERLIARTGAVKLLRQYAQDLAQRDAEISLLRNRADNRERELKRLLRLADVPSAEIEKRLSRLEKDSEVSRPGSNRQASTSMHGMMQIVGWVCYQQTCKCRSHVHYQSSPTRILCIAVETRTQLGSSGTAQDQARSLAGRTALSVARKKTRRLRSKQEDQMVRLHR